jgi:anti-sigma factor RsiW
VNMLTEKVWLRTTTATCPDASRTETLIFPYVKNELSPIEKEDFEAHVRTCEYCAACVYNWKKSSTQSLEARKRCVYGRASPS